MVRSAALRHSARVRAGERPAWRAAAAALVRHLRGRPIPDDRKAVERIGMYLVRRGFAPETARRAIRTRREPA